MLFPDREASTDYCRTKPGNYELRLRWHTRVSLVRLAKAIEIPLVPKPNVTTYRDACSGDPRHDHTLYEDDYIRSCVFNMVRLKRRFCTGIRQPSYPPTTSKLRETDDKGNVNVVAVRAWQAMQIAVGIHWPENITDTTFDTIAVELKYVPRASVPELRPVQ